MAKQRIIRTSIRDDPYILELSKEEKLVFIYLLTNENVEICGIYEIPPAKIAFHLSMQTKTVEEILNKLEEDGKIQRHECYIHIVNFIKHQNMNPSVEKGVIRGYDQLPQEVLHKFFPQIVERKQQQETGSDRLGTGWVQPLTGTDILNLTLPNLTLLSGERKKNNEFENLEITAQEEKKLKETYGEQMTRKYMDKLNNYIGSKGAKYESHYFTILVRMEKEGVRPLPKKQEVPQKETKSMTTQQRKRVTKQLGEIQKNLLAKTGPPGK